MPMFKKSLLVLLVLALTAALGTWYGYESQDDAVRLASGTVEESKNEAEVITVYVTGAVNQPGVVSVPEGARASDAVNACQGLLPTADKEHINLAQVLKDGQKLSVPEKSGLMQEPQKTDKGEKKAESGQLVNLNTADAAALDALPGVGPAMAKRIIEFRENEGGFQEVSDLKKVKGIGEAKFAKLKDMVCL